MKKELTEKEIKDLIKIPATHCSWCDFQYAGCPESGNENIDITNCKSFKKHDKEFIICAAVRVVGTDKIYYGHRHCHCITALHGELSWELSRKEIQKIDIEDGFVTNKNRFVNRKDALIIAVENKQILDLGITGNGELYSEDLY
jgi:hypothetical protein